MWLVVKDGKFEIMKILNGENLLVYGVFLIFGCDVWEYFYYIDYCNVWLKYLEVFVDSMVNWDYVLEMYEVVIK